MVAPAPAGVHVWPVGQFGAATRQICVVPVAQAAAAHVKVEPPVVFRRRQQVVVHVPRLPQATPAAASAPAPASAGVAPLATARDEELVLLDDDALALLDEVAGAEPEVCEALDVAPPVDATAAPLLAAPSPAVSSEKLGLATRFSLPSLHATARAALAASAPQMPAIFIRCSPSPSTREM